MQKDTWFVLPRSCYTNAKENNNSKNTKCPPTTNAQATNPPNGIAN
jgi:hypothetical protein